MKLDILAFGVHPDDVELGCSGTLAKHIVLGKKAGIIDLTQGELGTRGNKDLRMIEAQAAAKILKVSVRENLFMKDGFVDETEENLIKIIEKIRLYKPEIVLCNAIEDRHPDHGRAAQLIARSCFLSGLIKITTNHAGTEQEAWRPSLVLHYIQDHYIKPNLVIDITGFMDIKMEAIKAFSSQFHQKDSSEPLTPIAREDFLPFVEARSRDFGRIIGTTFAEGFTSSIPFKVNSLFDIL